MIDSRQQSREKVHPVCAPHVMANSTPPHTPRTPGSEPGYGPVRPSDHSPFDPLRERRPPALPYGDQGLVTVGALTRCLLLLACLVGFFGFARRVFGVL